MFYTKEIYSVDVVLDVSQLAKICLLQWEREFEACKKFKMEKGETYRYSMFVGQRQVQYAGVTCKDDRDLQCNKYVIPCVTNLKETVAFLQGSFFGPEVGLLRYCDGKRFPGNEADGNENFESGIDEKECGSWEQSGKSGHRAVDGTDKSDPGFFHYGLT